MEKTLLRLIDCPYCGGELEIEDIYEGNEDNIVNGCLKCQCNEYPVLQGILNLKSGKMRRYQVELLKSKRADVALRISLPSGSDEFYLMTDYLGRLYKGILQKVLLASMRIWARWHYRKYIKEGVPFCNLFGDRQVSAYYKHRFSSETLWSVYPFLPLLKETGGMVLDMGCGAGHAAFLISKYVSPEKLICADYLFENLYLAKKYFVNEAQFICLDANHPLPFKNGTFNSVLMLDMLHYVQAQATLTSEIRRILSDGGLYLALHLHNSLVNNVSAGKPLTPQMWMNLLGGEDFIAKALPEDTLVEDFMLEDQLNLAKEYSENELNSSKALCIVGSKVEQNFKVFKGIMKSLSKHNGCLIINPIYKVKREKDMVSLERRFPNKVFETEYPLAAKYLPQKVMVRKGIFQNLRSRVLNVSTISEEDLPDIESLMKKFVIFNAPTNYIG